MSDGPPLRPVGTAGEAGLTVQVRFALQDEGAARELAAKLIDRAHELANLPQCECDLDVDVRWSPGPAPVAGGPAAGPAAGAQPAQPPDR